MEILKYISISNHKNLTNYQADAEQQRLALQRRQERCTDLLQPLQRHTHTHTHTHTRTRTHTHTHTRTRTHTEACTCIRPTVIITLSNKTTPIAETICDPLYSFVQDCVHDLLGSLDLSLWCIT